MRTFVVLCLVAAAAAQYEYGAQTGGNIVGVGADDFAAAIGGAQNDYSESTLGGGDFEKEFFTFTAPEAEFDDNNAAEKIAGSLKKNLRVVFIKGPENAGLENAALQLAKSAAQDRTAIYVLNKQADIGDLANKLNNLNKNANSKPEVHFVKYRTDSDAENAQRTIQAQYDSLPGASSSTNGGAAPVLDFSSKSSVLGSGSSNTAAAPSGSFIAPQSSYLPPGRRF
ncbi:uncharacterized protein LOC106083645 [Stomoxys calcitrans]|uniref:uncharacterized protein LOC106083645 n=1 Tax=Stomoxys calcitrans TaxID=35570 RepID=UPI0027E2231A|nr:uncharacterized protein LOC106083645 [Stomoxys calcitrans]